MLGKWPDWTPLKVTPEQGAFLRKAINRARCGIERRAVTC